jgi:hypothetical protein
LDIARLRDELQPAVHGQVTGAVSMPPSNATGLDTRELEILRACQNAADSALTQTKLNCETLLMSIEHLSPARQRAEINSVQSAVIGQIRTRVESSSIQMRRRGQHCVELETALGAFRKANGLSRPPSQPASRTFLKGALVAMVVVEAAMNGIWFAEGNDLGLVGGVGQALVFAAVNIALGFLAGRTAFRYVLHRSWQLRCIAMAGIAVFVATALGLNLAIAHYRDLAQVSSSDASAKAIGELLSKPLALSDLGSWLLLAMGLLFSALACWDGFMFDDPYPGYGRRHRELVAAQDDLSDFREDVLRELERIRDSGSKNIGIAVRNASAFAQQRVVLASRLVEFVKDYERHCKDVKYALRVLIEEYRNANRKARPTQAPPYFDQEPQIDLPPTPDSPVPPVAEDIAQVATAAVEQIDRAHTEAIGRVRSLSAEAA